MQIQFESISKDDLQNPQSFIEKTRAKLKTILATGSLKDAIKNYTGPIRVSSDTVKVIDLYYEKLYTLPDLARKSNDLTLRTEVYEAILAEFKKNPLEAIFNEKPAAISRNELNEIETRRYSYIFKLYRLMILSADEPALKVKIFAAYIDYSATIKKDFLVNIGHLQKAIVASVEDILELKPDQIRNILETKEGENHITGVLDALFEKFLADKEAWNLEKLAETYLNVYLVGCELNKENIKMVDKVCQSFDAIAKISTEKVNWDDFYTAYYNALKNIILSTKNSTVEADALSRLEQKNSDSTLEESRVHTLAEVYTKLIAIHKDNRVAVGQFKRKLNQLTQQQKTKSDSVYEEIGEAQPFFEERKQDNRLQKIYQIDQAQDKRRIEILESEVRERKEREATETDKKAFSKNDYTNVTGSEFKKIQSQLLTSEQFKRLEKYGSTHQLKKAQISEYATNLKAAKSLYELMSVVKSDPQTLNAKYSMRENTATFGLYRFFHTGKSTTDDLALELNKKLQEIIKSEKDELVSAHTSGPLQVK